MKNVPTQGQAHQETGKPVGEWSDAEISAAVAERCGWRRRVTLGPFKGRVYQWIQKIGDYELEHFNCPDFASDLNAMAEAEKTLTDKQWDSYIHWLINGTRNSTADYDIRCTRATARQRAVAFIQTLSPVSADSTPNGTGIISQTHE